jgi:hypothetical protein
MITLGMFRSAVFFVTVVGGFGVACDVGSVLAQEGGGDGGGSGGSGGTGSDCPAVVTPPPTGHHPYNGAPGDVGETPLTTITAAQVQLGCMGAAGCHNGSNAPTSAVDVWDYGGVAYQDLAGTTPYAGATILLGTEPSSGTPQYTQMTVGANGFFYHEVGIDTFPSPVAGMFINSWICVGTNKVIMSQSLATISTQNTGEMTTDGNCNGGTACHGVAGSTGGEYIYLTPM